VRECPGGFFGTKGRALKALQHEFLPPPERGRRFVARRRVRLGDVDGRNRLRLDAIARYLQDVAADDVADVADSGVEGAWVLRRTALVVGRSPRYGDDVEITTFCSGTGPRWAERRTTLAIDDGPFAEAAAIWVFVDRAGRPARLGDWFFDHYGEGADGREVSGRLSLPSPPAHAHARPWPIRASDFDLLRHVNNAAYWYAVEDELARLAPDRVPSRAELEHRAAIEPGDPVELRSTVDGDVLSVWLTTHGEARSAARIRFATSPGARQDPR
jgi:acyl-ACP thioesterase